MLFAELSPELGVLKIYSRSCVNVSVSGSVLQINEYGSTLPHSSILFPAEYPLANLLLHAPVDSAGVWCVTARLCGPLLTAEQLHCVYGSNSFLFEDWIHLKSTYSVCAVCGSAAFEGKLPQILPSTTWGFEDMRVCEECGPCHAKKSKHDPSKSLFVGDRNVYLVGVETYMCQVCGLADAPEPNAHEKSVLSTLFPGEPIVGIPKSALCVYGGRLGRTVEVPAKKLYECILFVGDQVFRGVKCLTTSNERAAGTNLLVEEWVKTPLLPWSPQEGWNVNFLPLRPKLMDL